MYFRQKCRLLVSVSPFKKVVARLHLEGVFLLRTLLIRVRATKKNVETSAVLLNQAFMQLINVQLFSVNTHS